jgi:hypothetical protein
MSRTAQIPDAVVSWIDGTWLFAERLLYVDWLEERALA